MKRLITAIVLLLSPLSVQAQESEQGGVILPLATPCNTSENVLEILSNKFKEAPIGLGDGVIYDPTGKLQRGQIVLWKNHDAPSFTITFTPAGTDVMCFVITGKDLTILSSALGDSI